MFTLRNERFNRFNLFPLALLVAGSAFGQSEWKTSVPYTYNIDYSQGHVGNPDYLKKIAEAPPTLMHVGEDVVFSSVFGVKDGFGGPQRTHTKVITAAEARQKMKTLQEYTAAMHAAGVRWIIPYINNHAVLGDYQKRIGFWEFFDQWDRFREFGFGPRPSLDIITAQMQSGYPRPTRLREVRKDDPNYPYRRYGMCTNNPIWLNFLKAVTLNIARSGMDGVFADEMTLRDYCQYDESLFRKYLGEKYSEAERRRRFGRSDLASLSLGHPGDGALYYDTQAFWSYSNGQFLKAMREEGKQVNPQFFVMANLGPFAHIAGAYQRASGGKDPAQWAPYTKMIMFEEMQRPGELAPGVFFDNILQFKLAFGMGFVGGTLLYYAQEPPGIELSMAEAGAGGGGAFIEGGYREPASRRKYRQFFESHAELFDGYESHAEIAVVFDYGQAWWGNSSNFRAVYPLSQYLSERHILYDVIPVSALRAGSLGSRYKAVITPGVRYMAGDALASLRQFADSGGVWLDIDESGKFDDAGQVRVGPKLPRLERAGKGVILRRDNLEEVLRPPRFALFLLTESEANNLKEIESIYQASRSPLYPKPASDAREDLQALLEAHGARLLPAAPVKGLEGLRANVWQKKTPGGRICVAHFVNYNSPIPTKAEFKGEDFDLGGPPAQYAPKILENVPVRLKVQGKVVSAAAFDPDNPQPAPVAFRQSGDRVEFTLPPVRIYRIVRLELK